MHHVLHELSAKELRDGYRQYIEEFSDIVELARDNAQDRYVSHRDFMVGNVGVCIQPGREGISRIPGANYKLVHHEDDDENESEFDEHPEISELHTDYGIPRNLHKLCAETDVILRQDMVRDYGNDVWADVPQKYLGRTPELSKPLFFIAHIVVATLDTDDIASVMPDSMDTPTTLPPCDECSVTLPRCESTSNATQYVSAGLEGDIFQIRMQDNLKNLYQNNKDDSRVQAEVGMITRKSTDRALDYYDKGVNSRAFRRPGSKPSAFYSNLARDALMQTRVSF